MKHRIIIAVLALCLLFAISAEAHPRKHVANHQALTGLAHNHPAVKVTESSDRLLPRLGWHRGHQVASIALLRTYGGPWQYGYAKHLDHVRRLSRTRLRFSYSFNHRHGGFVTVWRVNPKSNYNRYTLYFYVSPTY